MSRASRLGRAGLVAWLLACVWPAAHPLAAGDWPGFRGPHVDGITDAKNVPQHWSATDNVRWSAPLTRPGNGSPIVVGPRVFVTSAEDDEGHLRTLFAFDLADGHLLWKRTAALEVTMPTHQTNPYGGTTPASDGRVVVVWHATAGLHCYTLEGEPVWHRDLGEFRHIWGYGSSPVIHDGRVILNSGPGQHIFVAAFNLANGDTLWQQDEPVEGDGSETPDHRYFGSWSTPIIAEINRQVQAVVALPTRVAGFDVKSGERLWWCEGLRHEGGDLAYSSPLIAGDVLFMTGGYNGPAMGVRLGGSGNVTESHRLWRSEKNPQSIGSGIVAGGYVYRPNAGPGTIQCFDPQTGEQKWISRGPGGDQWASLVLADGLAYATAQNGTTAVFRPSPQAYEEVGQNELGEAINATPAVVDGALVFRTAEHLICIGR